MKAQLNDLRKLMKDQKIDLDITKDADDHISEYNDRYFSTMEYISGFTGGDGTLVVTADEAGLWTDGRYFIQAAIELEGSGITLMKEGEPECPVMEEWILSHLSAGDSVGFDGRCLSYSYVKQLSLMLAEKSCRISYDNDLISAIWKEGRPERTAEKIWILEEKWAGLSTETKLACLKKTLSTLGAKAHVISAMDEIAWLLNLRGGDVPNNPVFDSFLLLDSDELRLYVSDKHLTPEVIEYLEKLHVMIIRDTDQIYQDLTGISAATVLIDGDASSYQMVKSIPEGKEIIFTYGPVSCMKTKKNATEAANLEIAQLRDSVAVTRFMYWFKKQLEEGKQITECFASTKLHEFRAQQKDFLDDSFVTISAYGANAAMCHYSPSPERDVMIEAKGLYLVDSGGHYLQGSTDITRTWSCGPVSLEEKEAYTLVACANLRLADSVFPDKTSGLTLDYAARQVFWKKGIDYNHGTGHGVGYLLYVHEGPANIRYKATASVKFDEMSEGVYVSDEPGYYLEGKFGIRLENMVLVEKAFSNEFHNFMKFKVLTLVPFDRSCIDAGLMTDEDIRLYNEYHDKVLQSIGPLLNEEEKEWLKKQCEPLKR